MVAALALTHSYAPNHTEAGKESPPLMPGKFPSCLFRSDSQRTGHLGELKTNNPVCLEVWQTGNIYFPHH